ncbi:MAG: PDZ domain-containing protein [Acidobacteriaceae bacterium]|jgi:serine protease Do|nr:PDZ domain-containing protein [Acidobacteriaceae bacterium]
MSTRKTTLFYASLIAVSSLAVGMVLASRFDLTPPSSAQTLAVPPMNSAPITGALDAQTFRNIAKAQQPMVVNIRTESQRTQDLSDFFGGGGGGGRGGGRGGGGGQSPNDLFRRFFGGPDTPDDQDDPQPDPQPRGGRRGGRPPVAIAAGTGFIISKDGLILTNNHVVEGATKIEVALFGEDSDPNSPNYLTAKLVGRDALTDSALIQLVDKPNHPLPVAQFGDSSQMAAGDWVMAIGNPFSQGWTVTVGVISATQRQLNTNDGRPSEMLQTDAAINPGNSGGPLLNLRGEVVGINTMIFTNGNSEGNIGIGFAVPINTIRELLPQLNTGKVTRGRIGLSMNAVPRDGFEDFGLKSRAGALVASVVSGGPADKAGIKAGDVVTEFNGRPVTNTTDLQKMVTATRPGTSVAVKVVRNGKEQTLHATVEELDLEAERGARASNNTDRQPPETQGQDSFGLALSDLTPQVARRLQIPSGRAGAVITQVDPNGPSAGALQQGDVILSINGQAVSSATEAGRQLQQIQSGRIARILVWRNNGEVFTTVRKEAQ